MVGSFGRPHNLAFVEIGRIRTLDVFRGDAFVFLFIFVLVLPSFSCLLDVFATMLKVDDRASLPFPIIVVLVPNKPDRVEPIYTLCIIPVTFMPIAIIFSLN